MILKSHHIGQFRRGFTLIEMLVVIAITAVMVALLVPALSAARRHALVIQCASNLRQTTLAMISYSYENKGQFPESGGGQSPRNYSNRFQRAVQIRDDFLAGDSRMFHCPVARPLYSTPTWEQATRGSFAAHGQIGYIYLGGQGDPEEPGGGYRSGWGYYGWYSQTDAFNPDTGRRVAPTYSRTEAEKVGNPHERPLIMDVSTNTGRTSIGAGLSFRTYANPAHGPFRGSRNPPDQNVGYVDGHVEKHDYPFRNKPLRTNSDIGLHF